MLEPQSSPVAEPVAQPEQTLPSPDIKTAEIPKAKNGSKTILIVAAVLVVLIVITVAIILMLKVNTQIINGPPSNPDKILTSTLSPTAAFVSSNVDADLAKLDQQLKDQGTQLNDISNSLNDTSADLNY